MLEQEVKECLEKRGLSWDDFENWMTGQTLSSDKAGNTIYWTHDVQRFIDIKLHGKRGIFFD